MVFSYRNIIIGTIFLFLKSIIFQFMKVKHIHGRKLGIPNFIYTSMPGYTYSLKSKIDVCAN